LDQADIFQLDSNWMLGNIQLDSNWNPIGVAAGGDKCDTFRSQMYKKNNYGAINYTISFLNTQELSISLKNRLKFKL